MPGALKLTLLVGPVPMPAPAEAVEALAEAKIVAGSGDTPSGFELTFDLAPRSPLRTLFLLTGGGAAVPLLRVVLVVTFAGRATPVADGVVTHVEMVPGAGGVGRLVVKGKDLSALMDLVEYTGLPFPAMPPAARVAMVLAKYAAFGAVPMVIPSVVEDIPLPMQRTPTQKGTDYAYVKRLADECGHVFYFEPGPVAGASKAYWGPEVRVGAPQPALTINMDAATNVEQMSFSFDKERKITPVVRFQEPNSKQSISVPIPDVTPLNPPLGAVPPLPPKIQNLDNTAQMSSASALMSGIAFAARHSDSVFGSGRLDVARYGRVLQSRRLVGVRGAGLPYDGLYYVTGVTHEIRRGHYAQSFSLVRNALVSTLPTVPV
jgi:hypothetical protein